MRYTRRRMAPAAVTIPLVLALVLASCQGDDTPGTSTPEFITAPTEQPASGQTSTEATGSTAADGSPTATADSRSAGGDPESTGVSVQATAATDTRPRLTEEELERLQPNELGQIVVLEYHQIGPEPEQFVRTPDQFRGDLQWLYDNDFYVVNLHDVLDFHIDVPAGKRPVVLTFDDSSVGQFRLIPQPDGNLAVDPDSAIGIMEDFFRTNPDFGRGGHFAVLPFQLFNWPDAYDQSEFGEAKLTWLVESGYEIGNHTYEHANLVELDDGDIMYQLAEANIAIRAIVPAAEVRVITLPYGMFPPGGDDTLFRGFMYQGEYFEWDASLLIGANPSVSPISTEYDPYWIARIQAYDEELARWFEVIDENPGILFVSDGNPDTVTVPYDLHPWLVGTLNESAIGDRELIRY